MSIGSRVLSGVVMAALAATVAAATAQVAQPPPQPPQPTFRTEANYVRVDVYPTRDGAPVADLTQADFEILEDRAPQKIEQFEHVVIRGNLPQEMRREPNSVAESRAAIQNPRARVFVVFLDTGQVDVGGSHNIRQPLIDTLNRVIGEEDLVAVMTPDMSARDLTFARKTTTIEGFLTRHWDWGDRDRLVLVDPVEKNYEACFGVYPDSPLTQALVNRRREKMTLDALTDLVVYLRGAREERKAVIAITDGWALYGPDERLESTGGGTPPAVGLNPGTGKLQIGDKNRPNGIATSDCMRDLMLLARIDDAQEYRRLLDAANAANTSFYPIDPRGLAVFDSPISQPLPLQVDAAALRTRAGTLRTLAESTDGIAIIQNDLARGLRRIVDDVSSYYLLGYYSTGKLDGRFHSITVHVKRPGVQVRARRGYLAATPQAVNATVATAAATAAKHAADAEAHAMDEVLSPLAAFAHEMPIRVQAATGWNPGGTAVWLVGELGSSEDWKSGAEADVTLISSAGVVLATAHATVPIGTTGPRTFRVTLAPAEPLEPGEYSVRVRARGAASTATTNETAQVLVSASPGATGAIFIRRGPATGNKEVPTADLRFRRSEQLRVEVPATAGGTARLLDRTGKALMVPVTAAVRDDADGSQWQTAQLALAPLAPGDYVIELNRAGGPNTVTRTLVAFRVVP